MAPLRREGASTGWRECDVCDPTPDETSKGAVPVRVQPWLAFATPSTRTSDAADHTGGTPAERRAVDACEGGFPYPHVVAPTTPNTSWYDGSGSRDTNFANEMFVGQHATTENGKLPESAKGTDKPLGFAESCTVAAGIVINDRAPSAHEAPPQRLPPPEPGGPGVLDDESDPELDAQVDNHDDKPHDTLALRDAYRGPSDTCTSDTVVSTRHGQPHQPDASRLEPLAHGTL